MPPSSEWDAFTGRRIWGVIGVVDCTGVSRDGLEGVVREARRVFLGDIDGFGSAAVCRIVVFSGGGVGENFGFDVSRADGRVMPSPTSAASAAMMDVAGVGEVSSRPVSIGYIPLGVNEEVRLEVRAQIVHFAGLLLSALQSWMEAESIGTDVFMSPLDERNPADKQSKLAKRRLGRLDKLHGDYCLLTGSAAEALVKFNSAAEKAKANGDSLWLAASMEGAATAQVFVHGAAGGQLDDGALVARIIEQYSHVYKLYQKKSVAELEAGAAMRLAEFLGRWTSLRKDSLEAVEHAARVGEGLRSAKRQALWEELASFCESMGWRRRAALYLYRIGSLCASQNMWVTAVSRMTASARQFQPEAVSSVDSDGDERMTKTRSRGDRQAWPDLQRQVLLEAAHTGRMAGMASEAAGHLVHALSLSPAIAQTSGESDSVIVDLLLSGGKVPAWIPHANELVQIVSLEAVQMTNLSVVERQTGDGAIGADVASANFNGEKDPFLYNPFAARAAAKEKAEASRAVTWVCGELAHIELNLRNRLQTRLSVEVIAVCIAEENNEKDVWPQNLELFYSSTELSSSAAMSATAVSADRPSLPDSIAGGSGSRVEGALQSRSTRECRPVVGAAAKSKTQKIRSTLRAMSKVATTISQNVNLAPSSEGASTFSLSVIPRRTGAMHVCGVVLRLFSGAIIMLPTPRIREGGVLTPPIFVMAPLPKLDVSIQADPCASTELSLLPCRLKLFEGEHTRAHVWITNTGSDDIAGAVIHTVTDKPDALRVLSAAGNSNIQTAVSSLRRGKSKCFEVQIYAVRPERSTPKPWGDALASDGASSSSAISVSVEVKYTGRNRNTHFRMTTASLVTNVSPAIVVERLSHFRLFLDDRSTKGESGESLATAGGKVSGPRSACDSSPSPLSSLLGIVIDVATRAAVPVQVSVVSTGAGGGVAALEGGSDFLSRLKPYMSSLVEGGACARLLSPLDAPTAVSNVNDQSVPGSSKTSSGTGRGFALKWTVPTLGRSGVVPLHVSELEKVFAESMISPVIAQHTLALSPTSASIFESLSLGLNAVVKVDIQKGLNSSSDVPDVPSQRPASIGLTIITRQFYIVQVVVKNKGMKALPSESTVDVHVCQRDGRGGAIPVVMGVLVGAHESVIVGPLEPGKVFRHVVQLRLSSTGLFDIVARLHGDEAEMSTEPLQHFLTPTEDSVGDQPVDSGAAVYHLDASNVRASASPSLPKSDDISSGDGGVGATPSTPATPILDASPGAEPPSSHRTSLQPSLKRVGLTRGRRATAGNNHEGSSPASPRQTRSNISNVSPVSANAVRPFAASAEVPVEYSAQRNTPPIATGSLSLRAANDTRWSSGMFHSIPTSQDSAGQSLGSLDPNHHGPDTIVH